MCAFILFILFGVVVFGVVSALGHILVWAFILAVLANAVKKRS